MSNTIIFQNTKIWRNDVKTDNGEFSAYSVRVSNKNQDGTWENAYLPIRFAKSSEAPERISNGTVADLEGFLTTKKRKDGHNEVQMVVMRLNIQDELVPSVEDISEVDSFELAADQIPF